MISELHSKECGRKRSWPNFKCHWQLGIRPHRFMCGRVDFLNSRSLSLFGYIKGNTSAQQYSFSTIKVSNRQNVSTNQVVIIRSITERYRVAEGCAHIWDPISVYKWAYW